MAETHKQPLLGRAAFQTGSNLLPPADGSQHPPAALLPAHLAALDLLPPARGPDRRLGRAALRFCGDGGELLLYPQHLAHADRRQRGLLAATPGQGGGIWAGGTPASPEGLRLPALHQRAGGAWPGGPRHCWHWRLHHQCLHQLMHGGGLGDFRQMGGQDERTALALDSVPTMDASSLGPRPLVPREGRLSRAYLPGCPGMMQKRSLPPPRSRPSLAGPPPKYGHTTLQEQPPTPASSRPLHPQRGKAAAASGFRSLGSPLPPPPSGRIPTGRPGFCRCPSACLRGQCLHSRWQGKPITHPARTSAPLPLYLGSGRQVPGLSRCSCRGQKGPVRH